MSPYSAPARRKFGERLTTHTHYAADAPAAITDKRGLRTDFLVEAEIATLLYRGAAGAINEKLDLSGESSHLVYWV